MAPEGMDNMKIRTGFVSNSSSTSFTCDICGNSETGMDSCTVEDYGFYRCINGHIICQEEAIGTEIEHEDYEDTGEYSIKETNCPICQFLAISNPDIKRYLKKTRGVDEKEAFDEIKKINKRRKVLRTNEYVQYVCRKFNLTEDILIKEIKEKFSTYRDFMSTI